MEELKIGDLIISKRIAAKVYKIVRIVNNSTYGCVEAEDNSNFTVIDKKDVFFLPNQEPTPKEISDELEFTFEVDRTWFIEEEEDSDSDENEDDEEEEESEDEDEKEDESEGEEEDSDDEGEPEDGDGEEDSDKEGDDKESDKGKPKPGDKGQGEGKPEEGPGKPTDKQPQGEAKSAAEGQGKPDPNQKVDAAVASQEEGDEGDAPADGGRDAQVYENYDTTVDTVVIRKKRRF